MSVSIHFRGVHPGPRDWDSTTAWLPAEKLQVLACVGPWATSRPSRGACVQTTSTGRIGLPQTLAGTAGY